MAVPSMGSVWLSVVSGRVRGRLSVLVMGIDSADGAGPRFTICRVAFPATPIPVPPGISVERPLLGGWRGPGVVSAAQQVSGVRGCSPGAVAVAVVPGRGRTPGHGGFALLPSTVVSRLPSLCPSVCPVWLSFGWHVPDPPAHGVVRGEDHAPGVGHVRQQQLREVAVGTLVPVHAVTQPVLPRVAEVEMEVEHVEATPHRLGRAVEVGLDHIFPHA